MQPMRALNVDKNLAVLFVVSFILLSTCLFLKLQY